MNSRLLCSGICGAAWPRGSGALPAALFLILHYLYFFFALSVGSRGEWFPATRIKTLAFRVAFFAQCCLFPRSMRHPCCPCAQVELLIKNHAFVGGTTTQQRNFLHMAALSGSLELLEIGVAELTPAALVEPDRVRLGVCLPACLNTVRWRGCAERGRGKLAYQRQVLTVYSAPFCDGCLLICPFLCVCPPTTKCAQNSATPLHFAVEEGFIEFFDAGKTGGVRACLLVIILSVV